ncbi:MAG: hypothetical protein QOD50_1431 [Actinomycetota bacterium]|nr:hypothetical protein [Actinomycetota bacterium]
MSANRSAATPPWYAALRRAVGNGVRRIRALPVAVVALLVFAVWLAATLTVNPPSFSFDGSWWNGIDWAIVTDKQFGSAIDFTYGPWADLDKPSVISLRVFLPAAIGAVVTGILLMVAAWKLARNWMPVVPAALVVALIAAPAVSVAFGLSFSGRVLLLGVMCAFGFSVAAFSARWRYGTIVALAVLSGLAVLVKFPNGILAVGTTLLIAALCTDRGLARKAVAVLVALAVSGTSVVVFWALAGQNFGNLVPWFGASFQLTAGYADAMGIEESDAISQYGVLFALLVVLVVLAVMRRGSSRVVLLILVAWVFVVALRLGFTRHDFLHTRQSFVLLLGAVLALGLSRQIWLGLVSLVVATVATLAMGPSYFHFVNPVDLAATSAESISAVVSPSYRANLVDAARKAGADQYDVPTAVLAAIGDQPVHIDPDDANVGWVYSLNWDPVPVFQSYSAYTPELDELNSATLTAPKGPRAVLRAPLFAIDGRNPMWDSPSYIRTLVCNYLPSVTTAKWQLLERSTSRCGAPSVLSTVSFSSGQHVPVPAAPNADYMVVARLSVPNSPLNWLSTEAFKPVSTLVVTTNQHQFRLPRALAAAPLILTIAKSAGWAAQFGGDTNVTSLSVNAAGTVVFSAIPVTSGN